VGPSAAGTAAGSIHISSPRAASRGVEFDSGLLRPGCRGGLRPCRSVEFVEEQIQQITRRLTLEARLAAVEQTSPRAGDEADAPHLQHLRHLPERALDPFAPSPTGRALIIVGGAFLLRALTESGTWPPWWAYRWGCCTPGVHALSTRAAAGATISAPSSMRTALLIGFPLILEATVKFHLFRVSRSSSCRACLPPSSSWPPTSRAARGGVAGGLAGATTGTCWRSAPAWWRRSRFTSLVWVLAPCGSATARVEGTAVAAGRRGGRGRVGRDLRALADRP